MSIQFPENRKEISDRIKADVKGNLPTSNPYLRNSFLQALIFGISGRIFSLFQTAKTLLKNLFWDTALGEYLERPASWFGITKNPATSSSGSITAPGTVGTVIPVDTRWQTPDGLEIKSTAQSQVDANTLSISSLTQSAGLATSVTSSDHELAPNVEIIVSGAVENEYNGTYVIISTPDSVTFTFAVDPGASTPATGSPQADFDTASVQVESVDQSEDTNLEAGTELVITNPIAGLEDKAYVQHAGLELGSDIEEDESLRDRFLFRVQNPFSLFNNTAIETEAKKINGVTRVWVWNVDITKGSISASSLTRSGSIATFVASAAHNLADGQKVSITGANEAGYNVTDRKIIVIDSVTFAYVVDGTPTSPATGTPIASGSIVEEGQVKIFFTRDNDEDIIPSNQEVQAVKDQILTIKPAHISDSDVITQAPGAVTTNYSFSSISPNTETMKTAIRNSLTAFYQESTDVGENILESQYLAAIANTVDTSTGQRLASFALSSPSGNIPIGPEEIGKLGTVTI